VFKLEKEFYELVKALQDDDYKATVYIMKGYDHIFATNLHFYEQDLYFGFCTPCSTIFEELSGKVAVYKGKFENWKDLIFNVPIPKNLKQIEFVLHMFDIIRDGMIDNYINEYSYKNIYGFI
jgi:hypothetical protein